MKGAENAEAMKQRVISNLPAQLKNDSKKNKNKNRKREKRKELAKLLVKKKETKKIKVKNQNTVQEDGQLKNTICSLKLFESMEKIGI